MTKKEELLELDLLYKIEKHIIDELGGTNITRGYKKLFDEYSATGKVLMYFHCDWPDEKRYVRYFVIEPEYLAQLIKEGQSSVWLNDSIGIYISANGEVKTHLIKIKN